MNTLPSLPPRVGQSLASDSRSLDSLRHQAAADPKAAVREVARQFEALFMQELMKSMRAATTASGLTDNAGTQLGTELLDQQLVSNLSHKSAPGPGSLSSMIARQLERQMGLSPGPIARPEATGSPAAAPAWGPAKPLAMPQKGAAAFLQQHDAAARQAEASTGIPASFMLGQAALETGWGRREIRHPDGSASNNLFGIKAGSGWKGPVAEVTTTEYIDGQPRKMVQRFRAYASPAESFADYARLMQASPRYKAVMASGGDAQAFANGLQRAGYATDPAYADKLARVINTTLRLQRSQA